MVVAAARDSSRDHVTIANGLYLFEVIFFYQFVKLRKDLVEQFHQFDGLHLAGHGREVHHIGEERSAAVGQVVPRYRGDDHMRQLHGCCRLHDTVGLLHVDGGWPPLVDGAEAAGAGTVIAQDHEGGCGP